MKRTKNQANIAVSGNPKCGLCGKEGNLTKTQCCNNWICDDAENYVLFSYARNSCLRNHDNYTICSYHHNNEHEGDWLTCQKCIADFDTEDYVDMATNEYNFVKLQNPPHFDPTLCSKCGAVIKRADGGYTQLGTEYTCGKCSDSPFMEPVTRQEVSFRDDWGTQIENYYAAKDWSKASPHLEYLHELSIELLRKTFSESPLLDEYCSRALTCASNGDSDELSAMLEEIGENYVMAFKISRRLKSLRLTAFARALQSIDNNYLITSAKGNKYSWLMAGIAEKASLYEDGFEKIELLPMIKGFADTHKQIDEILHTATPEYSGSQKLLSARQAAHYVADWLLQCSYDLFSEDTPEQIATSCWQILLERNPALEIPGLNRELLLKIGQWEDDASFAENIAIMQGELEDNMEDTSILDVK